MIIFAFLNYIVNLLYRYWRVIDYFDAYIDPFSSDIYEWRIDMRMSMNYPVSSKPVVAMLSGSCNTKNFMPRKFITNCLFHCFLS